MDETALAALQKQQALKDILTVGGLGLAGGVGVAGLAGLPSFFGRSKPKYDPRSPGPSVVTIPTPVYATAADQRRATHLKSAEVPPTRGDLKWYYPGMIAAGLGGLAGGAALTNHFLQDKAKSDLRSDEDDAHNEYQKAMLEQYDPRLLPTADRVPVSTLPRVQSQLNAAPPPPALKLASAEALDDLDKLADAYEKKALLGYDLPEMPSTNKLIGAYGAYAVPAAALGGLLSYGHFRDRSPDKLLQNAIKDRERERWARRPPEIYAVPQPVHVDRSGELAEAPERKSPMLAQLSLAGG